ncbi:MAG: PLP-dependent aspartate aminotransferase family protein [Candidatus Marsarchaeota archaeon]|nr:PLP-dependent aspartate aminotransferase family protein [Candidatus Marsarchaeota archaeon]
MEFETSVVHSGEEPNMEPGGTGDIASPIHLSSTFARKRVDKPTGGFTYSRTTNPTRSMLEARLAALEGAKHGLAFSSGLAAETSLLLALLKSGDHIVAFDDLYGGTKRLFDKVMAKFGVSVTYADATNPAKVKRAMRKNTRMVWLETPTNPLLKLCDIRAISEIAHAHSAVSVVDNTFATPYFQKPLELDADVSLYSTTKYMNGHSDSIGGAIVLSDEALNEKIKFMQNAAGAILSAFDSFLVLRGLKTLPLRMREHESNAMKVAEFLEARSGVQRVRYPGLDSHPQHGLAERQMSGFGGMITFEVSGGRGAAIKFLESLRLVSLAEDLGGVKSLAEHPASMTHADIPRAARERIGISEALVRLSVGIEASDDIIADIDQALARANGKR